MAVTRQPPDVPIERLLRELTPRVLGTVARRFRDFPATEDAVQEAALAAATRWPREGLPVNPRAWLTQVAFRRMTDQIRSESARRRRENEVTQLAVQPPEAAVAEPETQADDTLVLLFMCCHPALTPASAIALTLRAVGGLTTAEIAHAFLVPEATMAQRISRAKLAIKDSGIPFQLPTAADRTQRLRAVLHVLYLIFNEGYASSAGSQLQRPDLAQEALRLTRIVHGLQPDDTEVAGLLALMVLTDARRLARTAAGGEVVPLSHQDRTLWDRDEIAEGVALLSATLPKGSIGPYQLQAAIAAVHDEAVRSDDTDWPQILALYDLLLRISDNPMVTLNHAIAAAMVHGPAKGPPAAGRAQSRPPPGASSPPGRRRAHLLELAGDHQGAVSHFRAAAAKTGSLPERNYLLTQAARLSDPGQARAKAKGGARDEPRAGRAGAQGRRSRVRFVSAAAGGCERRWPRRAPPPRHRWAKRGRTAGDPAARPWR
jgi:RNA polymerase sigma factor (sigma-70 family)